MRPERHFVNLTNGLEAIERLGLENYRYVRIRSAYCELTKWGFSLAEGINFIMMDLGPEFLMSLALGYRCIVYDYTESPGERSHALSHGLPWVEYSLNWVWFGKRPKVWPVAGVDWAGQLQRYCRKGMSKPVRRRLKYYANFKRGSSGVSLYGVGGRTDRDGQWAYYRNLANWIALE